MKPKNTKLTSTGFKQQRICTPLAPTRNKIIYKTACSDGPNWVRKTFSKPASLKRTSLVVFRSPEAAKFLLKPKDCASSTLMQKTLQKNEPKHGPKNGTAWRSHLWNRMDSLVKEQKKSFSRSHFWDCLALPKMSKIALANSLHGLEDYVHHLCVVKSLHSSSDDVLAPLAVRA